MACTKCGSERVATVQSKSSDLNFVYIGNNEHNGYVPKDMGIGGDDYIELEYCLHCGQMQGEFPIPPTKLEGVPPKENPGK